MPTPKIRMAVEMENGDTWEIDADQRDLAKWEVSPFYNPDHVLRYTAMRYLAWSASVRQGKTDLTWPKFDAACVEAGDPEDSDDESLDPTQTGQHVGS